MKILLAADGSDFTRRAAQYLVEHVKELAKKPEVHILHVHAPIPYARAAAVAGSDVVHRYHQEESEAALKVAEDVLAAAGIPHHSAWVAGDVAPAVAKHSRDKQIDLIVMGSHGHGQLRNLALGSVADAVLRETKVPVLIVR